MPSHLTHLDHRLFFQVYVARLFSHNVKVAYKEVLSCLTPHSKTCPPEVFILPHLRVSFPLTSTYCPYHLDLCPQVVARANQMTLLADLEREDKVREQREKKKCACALSQQSRLFHHCPNLFPHATPRSIPVRSIVSAPSRQLIFLGGNYVQY